MDYSKLNSRDKREFDSWAQLHQVKQVIQMYAELSTNCFGKCVNDFSNESLSSKETQCTEICISKFINANARLNQTFAEHSELIYDT